MPKNKILIFQSTEGLNDRSGTNFTEEHRLFFEQIKEKAVKDAKVIDTARSNPLDKFELGAKESANDQFEI